VARNRSIEDLTVDELRQLLVEKRRSERHQRLEYYRKTGRVIMAEPAPLASPVESRHEPLLLSEEAQPAPRSRRRAWFDRSLFVIEVLAVAAMAFLLVSGANLLRNLNNEVSAVLVQPTLTPTPLVSAVILPSGHTPPTDPGGARFNEDEIPEHLRPLVQSLANIPLPTPGPTYASRVQIPAIGVDAPVVQGDGWEQLKKGVGQHVGTPNPGEKGNLVLSAHNDVFGEIFRDLDRLQPGDEIILSTAQQAYVYVVKQTQTVEPTQVEVMAPSQTPVVTLISCYPYMVDNQRIVVTAELQGEK
jgi:sortase A